jgi:haloacetate dehalogenase
MMDKFEAAEISVGDVRLFVRMLGRGPPLLLLHGFPETHVMWRDVAPLLAHRFTVVCADLPGYGRSGSRSPAPDHAPHAKRAMAADLVALMGQLGFPRFSVAGHDRGGRVGARLAVDHPDRVARLAVLDIVPSETAWTHADARLVLGFWPWSLLAQPEPLPERLLTAAPEAVIDDALGQWGSNPKVFPPDIRAAYTDALRDPRRVHAICEEYRAAATTDREHDQADQASARRITCPLLVLWSATGSVGTWYIEQGGPLKIWREWADDVQGHSLEAGHFFPEEAPEQTAEALELFFGPESRA